MWNWGLTFWHTRWFTWFEKLSLYFHDKQPTTFVASTSLLSREENPNLPWVCVEKSSLMLDIFFEEIDADEKKSWILFISSSGRLPRVLDQISQHYTRDMCDLSATFTIYFCVFFTNRLKISKKERITKQRLHWLRLCCFNIRRRVRNEKFSFLSFARSRFPPTEKSHVSCFHFSMSRAHERSLKNSEDSCLALFFFLSC